MIKLSCLRLAALLAAVVLLPGCGLFSAKSEISVPPVLTPLVDADTERLLAEINRLASVNSLSGRLDITFLDTSFAECGVADLYRTAEGRAIVQRPGQIFLDIQFLNVKIAEMSSNGERFWAALYQGDEKYRRFVTGTNSAEYDKLAMNGTGTGNGNGNRPDCRGDGKRQQAAQQRATVSALSSLRPQHFSDALLVPPALTGGSVYYARSEDFVEERDARKGAKRNARVVRGYYVLGEFRPDGPGRATLLRRFWFDRVGALRLARVQTYGENGQLVTDVVYGEQKPFAQGQMLPAQLELTRPQERYSIRVAFQDPSSVKVNQSFGPDTFVLKNESRLPEVDLDAKRKDGTP